MKKSFLTLIVICLFAFSAFAGGVDSPGYTCITGGVDSPGIVCTPTPPPPGQTGNLVTTSSDEPESVLDAIRNFLSENNPLNYFLN